MAGPAIGDDTSTQRIVAFWLRCDALLLSLLSATSGHDLQLYTA